MSAHRESQRRLRTLATLEEAVGALRSLSAQQLRVARARLAPARAYREEVLALTRAVLRPDPDVPGSGSREQALILVGPDLGLCGEYVARLAHEAVAYRAQLGPGPVFCVGRRPLVALARARITPERTYPAPASVLGLSRLLLPLVVDVLDAHRAGRFSGVAVVSARFAGVGRFEVVRTRVLPPEHGGDDVAPPLTYSTPQRLRAVVVREYLFVSLHETLVDALAAEHGTRLVVAQTAHSWLEERIGDLRRRISAIARETSTQEVIELESAARARAARAEGL